MINGVRVAWTLVLGCAACGAPCEPLAPPVIGATAEEEQRVLELLARFQADSGHQGVCVSRVRIVHHEDPLARSASKAATYRRSTETIELHYAPEERVVDGMPFRMTHELCHAFDFQTEFNSFKSVLWDEPMLGRKPFWARAENFAKLCELGGLGWQFASAASACSGVPSEQLKALGSVWKGLAEPDIFELGEPSVALPPLGVPVGWVDVQLWEGALIVDWVHDESSPGRTRERINASTGERAVMTLSELPRFGEGAGYTPTPELDPLVPNLFAWSSAAWGETMAYSVGQDLPNGSTIDGAFLFHSDGRIEVAPCLPRVRVMGDERGLWLVDDDPAGVRWWQLAGDG